MHAKHQFLNLHISSIIINSVNIHSTRKKIKNDIRNTVKKHHFQVFSTVSGSYSAEQGSNRHSLNPPSLKKGNTPDDFLSVSFVVDIERCSCV